MRWRARWRRASRSTSPVIVSAPMSRCCSPARARQASRTSSRSMVSAYLRKAPARAPAQVAASGSMRCTSPPSFAPYRDLSAVADRLQKTNPRLPRAKAEFLAPHWARGSCPTAPRACAPTRSTSCRFRRRRGWTTCTRCGVRSTAPVLWIAAADSHVRALARGGGDPAAEVARRFAHIPNGRLEIVADAGHMLHHDQPEAVARLLEAFLVAPVRLTLRALARRSAYAALVVLTLVWGFNWIAMKFALQHARSGRVQRAADVARRGRAVRRADRRSGGRFWPASWLAIVVTGFFQTTINFGSTTMALSGGGAGRTSVLVFTMPFWTLLIAWPVLHERVKGGQWFAVCFAFAGLALVVEPWNWRGDLAPEIVGGAVRLRLGRGLGGDEIFPAGAAVRAAQLPRVADAGGRGAADVAAAAVPVPGHAVERDLRGAARVRRGDLDRARVPAVDRGPALPGRPAPRRSTCSLFRSSRC